MINLQKCGIFLVLLLSVFLFFTQQINADTVVCDSWRCGSNESWDEFPCLPDTVSVDCGDGATGYCSGSTNIDYGSCRWFVNLNFWVTNQIGQPVSGALVEIYADYGNGNFRTTDGGGFANFGVYDNVTIDFDVSHNDCGIVYRSE